MSIQYIKSLDGYRAIAVIIVMLIHWGYLGAGWIGVQMFFVLSGYLISANLLRDRNKTDNISTYLKSFYWKRFLRLFPIYYAYIIVFIIIGVIYARSDIYKLIFPLLSYTVNIYAVWPGHADLANVGHFWSLGAEEQFYLVWPFLVFFCPPRYFRILIVAILFTTPLVRLFLFSIAMRASDTHYSGEVVNLLTISHIDAFATGAGIAYFPAEMIKRPKRMFWIMMVVVFVIGGLNLYYLFTNGTIGSRFALLSTGGFPYLMVENLQYVWGYTLLNLLCGSFIWCIVNGQNPLPSMGNPQLVYLGKISYGIYVFHVPVMVCVKNIFPGPIFSFSGLLFCIIYFALTFLIAHFSFEYYEKHFLKLKDRYNINKPNSDVVEPKPSIVSE